MNQQRTFLITGASKGIGYALSQRLAAAGHNVIGIARHAPERDYPGHFITLDLADTAAVQLRLREINAEFTVDGGASIGVSQI